MPLPAVRPEEKEESLPQFVAFRAGSQDFAVEIHRVKEVLPYRAVTPLPHAPAVLEGVIELRGAVVPVLDLRRVLGFADAKPDAQSRILILRARKRTIGLLVDAVFRVITVSPDHIDPPPEGFQGAGFVMAYARHESELYGILDPEKLLSTEQQTGLDQFKVG
jgi:purine-binding chemotaxis protein CheW